MSITSAEILAALSELEAPQQGLSAVSVELDPLDGVAELQGAVVDMEGNIYEETPEEEAVEVDHYDNLAKYLSDDDLASIGQTICDLVEEDIESRNPWRERYKRGLDALGLFFDDEAEVSDVFGDISHPLLIEAATQFQARAFAELFPADGPVKTRIIGQVTPEVEEQAQRVQDYMNYQLVYENRGFYTEEDKLLYRLPFSGSEFKKQYRDPITGKVKSRWVRAEDFIAPYTEVTLEDTPRYTHRLSLETNELRKYEKAGYYINIPGEDYEEEVLDDIIVEKVNLIDGIEVSTGSDAHAGHTIYETYVDYDIPGYEDPDGIALPYVITVDKATHNVLAIRRNWDEEDPFKQRVTNFTHRYFLPGFGLYGFGLIHTIGGLGEVATKVLQVLLDAGAFASLQGGFKSKDAKIAGELELRPGEWADTEMTADELARAFYTPPFKEPSQTLFQLLGAVTELGQRFAATTEVMVGDAATTGPVGTTVAQIEQGSKVFSGIHKRLHKALGDELINIAKLNEEYLEEAGGYPYLVEGGAQQIAAADFDERVDIIPVSDPNIFSSAQRIAMAQATYQIAQQMPDKADRREAAISLMRAMRVPHYEKIFPEPAAAERADPTNEAALLLKGRPLKAYMDQHHQAHIQVHMALMQTGSIPQELIPKMQAHISEHMAMQIVLQMQMRMGMPLPALDFDAKPTDGMMAQPVPPEIENQIALQAAQAAQQMLQEFMAQQQQQDENARKEQLSQQVDLQKTQMQVQAKVQDGEADRQARMAEKQADIETRRWEKELEAASKERIAAMQAEMQRQLKELELSFQRERDILQAEQENARELQRQLQESQDRQSDETAENTRNTEQQAQMLALVMTQMKMMQEALTRPKKLTFDERGRPIGVVPVEDEEMEEADEGEETEEREN